MEIISPDMPAIAPVKVYKIEPELPAVSVLVSASHRQHDFEFIWIQEGGGVHIVNGERYPLSKNVVYAALPGDCHELHFLPGTHGYIVHFSTSSPNATDGDFNITHESYLYHYFSRYPVLSLKDNQIQKMKYLIMLLENESSEYCPLHNEIVGKCLQLFQLYLRRHIESLANCYKSGNTLLMRYFWLLDKDFKTRKNVEDYARDLKVTANYLNNVVKRASGYPASYHIRQRLFQEAMKKANYSSYSMKEIAYDLNFNDMSHFSKFFKSMCGVSFSAYKRAKLSGAA
jgi:AraC family transcriptional regulator, transcriptional activator of pobA